MTYVKAHPGQVSYGSAGIGNTASPRAGVVRRGERAGNGPRAVQGLAPALQDVMGGTIQVTIGAGSGRPVRAGRQGQGVGHQQGQAGFDHCRVCRRLPRPGIQKLDASFPFSLLAPGGTPEALRQKIYTDVKKVVMNPLAQ